MLFSKFYVILQSEGGGGKKGQKIAIILNDVWPLIVSSLCLLSVLVIMVYHTSRDIYFIVIFCIFYFFVVFLILKEVFNYRGTYLVVCKTCFYLFILPCNIFHKQRLTLADHF